SCGVGEASSSTQTASAPKVKTKVTSAALTAAEKEAERLRQRVAALEAEKTKQQQTISSDTQKPTITASASSNGTDGIISGTVRDNVEVAEVLVGGQVVALNADGSFKTSLYVPRSGKTVEIVAVDTKGNKATKSLFLERGAVQGATGPVFASLNPSGKRVKVNKDALALIIGVADYERTPAKAAYADKDAKTFYDYAMLKLGISAGNIKELVNVDANRIDVSLAIKDWIARTTKQGSSDIYVFFAGHGLASQSGEQMYLLPYDGSPRLLEDSAISRDRLFADISAANPRSVTVFLDTCYSGTTRGTDMLIASRPIAIKALEQSIPDNFTVMTAARGDQTAKPLEEAKHGMFSYFLMKGMEGEADENQDNKITAGELHSYVQQNVVQQSSGSQTPELQGDAERVLVRFQ
ncbi:caspase family protein, partial [Candidatus Puniceispirillum sp.]|nr:caspase family protein [Candidatus Puniceispirillum sp.]